MLRYIPGVAGYPQAKGQPPCDASRPSQRTARRTPTTAIENPTTQHGSRRGHRRMVRTLDVSAATPASIPRPHKLTRQRPPLIMNGVSEYPRPIVSTDIKLLTGLAFTGEYTARFCPRSHTTVSAENPLQTAHHVTVACPLHAEPRRQLLLPVSNTLLISAVFGTKEGGSALGPRHFLATSYARIGPRRR